MQSIRAYIQSNLSDSWLYIGLVLIAVSISILNTAGVNALSYDVSAKVPAAVPTQAAVITKPSDGFTADVSQQIVSGTCQQLHPSIIESVWLGSQLLGSAVCSSGQFSIMVSLPLGTSTLVVRSQNVTQDFGPDSSALHITYSLPPVVTPPKPETPVTTTPGATTPVVPIQSEPVISLPTLPASQTFVVVTPNKEVRLTVNIKDGSTPYSMTVDWGDGSHTQYHFSSAGDQVITHTFKGTVSKSVHFRVVDNNGKISVFVLGVTTNSTVNVTASKIAVIHSSQKKYVPYIVTGSASIVVISAGLWGFHAAQQAAVIHSVKTQSRGRPRVKR